MGISQIGHPGTPEKKKREKGAPIVGFSEACICMRIEGHVGPPQHDSDVPQVHAKQGFWGSVRPKP